MMISYRIYCQKMLLTCEQSFLPKQLILLHDPEDLVKFSRGGSRPSETRISCTRYL